MDLFVVTVTLNTDCDDDNGVDIQLNHWRDGEIENIDNENEVDRDHNK